MDALAVPLLFVLSLVVAGFVAQQASAQSREQREEMTRLGLVQGEDGGWTGVVEGVAVQHGPHAPLWRVFVPTGGLSLWSHRPLGGEPVRSTGDSRFDLRYLARGTAAERSLLGFSVRAAILSMPPVRLREGVLECEGQGSARNLRSVLALARALREQPLDPAERLRQMTEEPLAEVRLHALHAAFEHDPNLGRGLAARHRQDDDPSVRGLASIFLQDEGLEATASSGRLSVPLRLWAARVLAKVGSVEQRERTGKLLIGHLEPALRDAGVALLRSLGPRGEGALLECLSRADLERLAPLARALGEFGSVEAVPALRARQAQLSVLQAGLSRDLEEAILSIQARAKGERGGLAIAGPAREQGALSLRERS